MVILWTRRWNPRYRNGIDKLFRAPISRVTQFFVNLFRKNDRLEIAEEKLIPNESEIAEQIAKQMTNFLVKNYQDKDKPALRAGNTKTYGVLRASFEVLADLPAELRQGIFRQPKTYPAWVRFGGPGPLATPDIENNGILSIGIKVMGVEGEKLLGEEKMTQDFSGISSPTFTTPNVVENLKLQREISSDTGVFYFINPLDSHILDGIMQGIYSKTHSSPLELRYFSCVPYLFGEGNAIQYSMKPQSDMQTPVPRNPSDNYLRDAMVNTLSEREVCIDFLVQFQVDSHKMPIENASVVWRESQSPFQKVATIRIPAQKFDSPAQFSFARNISINPWHCIAEHRPLGNQNRARKHIYSVTSRFRQQMNGDERIEPTGDEVFK